MKRATMRRRGDEVILSFEYSRELVAAIKSLPSRRFDAHTKEWVVPIHLYRDALAALEGAGAEVELDEEIRSLLRSGIIPEKERPEVVVSRCGDEYMIQFEYDPSLVRATKRVSGRTFDPHSKAWFIPIQDERGTLREILSRLRETGCSIRLEPKLRPLVS